MKSIKYSDEENQLLINELKINNGDITAIHMDSYSTNWPGFFGGIERSPYALYRQTINLAKKNDIRYLVQSTPKLDRSNWKKPDRAAQAIKKTHHYEQIISIIHGHVRTATQKATTEILRFLNDIVAENLELKKELKNLRPYKAIVEKNYQRELFP